METEKQQPENSARLKLTGFAPPPDEVTALLGLKPAATGQKGQPYQVGNKLITNMKWPQNHWEVRSTLAADEPLAAHLEQLLQQLKPKRAALKELLGTCQGELTLVSYLQEERNPNFRLSPELLREITELGLSLEVDIYLLEELEETP
jgi:hypothetical protein